MDKNEKTPVQSVQSYVFVLLMLTKYVNWEVLVDVAVVVVKATYFLGRRHLNWLTLALHRVSLIDFYKIIRIVRALSLVNSCVYIRVWKHGCDITQILIGYMPSDSRFDWLVGNMSVCQENLFHSRIFLHLFPSIVELSFEKYFIKAIEDFFPCFHSLI